ALGVPPDALDRLWGHASGARIGGGVAGRDGDEVLRHGAATDERAGGTRKESHGTLELRYERGRRGTSAAAQSLQLRRAAYISRVPSRSSSHTTWQTGCFPCAATARLGRDCALEPLPVSSTRSADAKVVPASVLVVKKMSSLPRRSSCQATKRS